MAREIKNLLVYHFVHRALERVAPLVRGRLIDIGCGTKPYEALFRPHVSEHVGVDVDRAGDPNSRVDVCASAYALPFDDATFDSALCTAVLEHLEEPEAALRECRRVLKPAGVAVYLVPFIWHLHEEPRDFYRFSKYGLLHLFTKTGFEVVEIRPLSGFWVTFGQLFVYYLYRYNRGPLRWLGVIPLLGLITQGLAFVAESVDKAESWTWMYLVVAKRAESTTAHP